MPAHRGLGDDLAIALVRTDVAGSGVGAPTEQLRGRVDIVQVAQKAATVAAEGVAVAAAHRD